MNAAMVLPGSSSTFLTRLLPMPSARLVAANVPGP